MPIQPAGRALSEETGVGKTTEHRALCRLEFDPHSMPSPQLDERLSTPSSHGCGQRHQRKGLGLRIRLRPLALSSSMHGGPTDADPGMHPRRASLVRRNADWGGWDTEPMPEPRDATAGRRSKDGGSRETRHGNEVIWDWGQGAHSVLRIPRACTSGQRVKRDEQRPATRRLSMWWTGWMVYGNRRHNTPRTMGTE